MGRPCGCCGGGPYNLMKLDPATGAILWRAFIPGDGTNGSQSLYRVEPLHGTNDIVASTIGGSGTIGLARVDSTGSQQWIVPSASAAQFPLTTSNPIGRTFGSDSSSMIVHFPTTTSVSAIDGTGTTVWTRSITTLNNIGLVCGTTFSIIATQITSLPLQFCYRKIDNNSNGADIWISAAISGSAVLPCSLDPTTSRFIGAIVGTSPSFDLREGLNGTVIRSMTGTARSRGCLSGGFSNATNTSAQAFDSTGGSLFNIGIVSGAIITSALLDTCSDGAYGYEAANYYFCGNKNGAGAGAFDVFNLDASGSTIWTQRFGSTTASPGTPAGLCLADDGYLYVSGGWNPAP